ncbi:ubiquinone biosynthesis protein [Glycocaulis profundi]|nr:ubiquinone biosynthesis protein [Glycocaulis profundi]
MEENPVCAERPPASSAARRVQPVRAMRALRRLIADQDDTVQVFEIMNALAGRSINRGYDRLLDTPEGGRQAFLQVELSQRLSDRVWLEPMPAGSVGAAYLDFMGERGFTADGLVGESTKIADTEIDAAHPRAWYARRLRDVHDVWHVLTGYGTDALGEACVVAFSLPQTRSAGFGLIAAGAGVQFARARTGHPCARAILRAWRDGRRAAWLPGQDYEAMMAEPLDAVRARLRIPRPALYEQVPPAVRDGYLGGGR